MKFALRLLLLLIISTVSNANFATPYKASKEKTSQQKMSKPVAAKPKIRKKKVGFFQKILANSILKKWTKKLDKKEMPSNVNTEETKKVEGTAVSGLVASLLGALFSFLLISGGGSGGLFFFSIIAAIIGIILSAIAIKKIKKNPDKKKGSGAAITGLVVGIGIIVGWGLLILAYVNGGF